MGQRILETSITDELDITAASATTLKTHRYAVAPNDSLSLGLLLSRRRTGAEDAGECVLIKSFRLQQRLR
jgi:hypothetical protein